MLATPNAKMWNNKHSHLLLMEMPNGMDTLEDSSVVSYKTKHSFAM